jgi:hypothetical protein
LPMKKAGASDGAGASGGGDWAGDLACTSMGRRSTFRCRCDGPCGRLLRPCTDCGSTSSKNDRGQRHPPREEGKRAG